MKKLIKEILIITIQILFFYIFPLFMGPTDAIGMVFILIFITFALSQILGIISNNKLKFLYPIITAVIFIPSVFIYYNESALIHAVWYLVIATIGMLIGSIINMLFIKIFKK